MYHLVRQLPKGSNLGVLTGRRQANEGNSKRTHEDDLVIKNACLIFVVVTALAIPAGAQDSMLYVAPTGDDTNPGTEAQPFRTLPRAQQEVRKIITGGLSGNVTVALRDGTYYFPETLTFDNRDSGTRDHSITYAAYPGEKVVLSGGRRITGWKPEDKGRWSVVVPEVAAGQWYFRELYVDGKRAIRARTPNANAKEPYYGLLSAKLSDDRRSCELNFGRALGASNWENISDVEVVSITSFEITRKQLLSANVNGTISTTPFHTKSGYPEPRTPPAGRCYLENAFAFLDEPGEWYLDRSNGVLRYWPHDGEDMRKAEVIAPVLIHLIEVKGTTVQPVKNLRFRNLTFAHSAWPLPTDGYFGFQACTFLPTDWVYGRMEAALSFQFAQSCRIEDCEIAHTGGYGVELRRGCSANTIQGNQFFDISANGIMIGEGRGEQYETNSAKLVRNNQVINNLIHDCGVSYYGAVGIWVGFTENTHVAHNLIHDLPYSGISVGWQWDKQPTNCKSNVIEYNHVHHVMQMMNDGGAIYTLGNQPGTIIRDNVVHDVGNTHNQARGLYLDQGSSGFLVESNVIYRVPEQPVWDIWASDLSINHTWRGNTFTRTDPLVVGIVGYGSLFENGSYLEIPHTPALEPATLTVVAWVKFIEFPTGKDPCVWIVNKNTNEFTNTYYALAVSHNNVGAYLNIGGGRDNCFASWSSDNPIQSNAWNHLAMTYDGRRLAVFCNGRLVGQTIIGQQTTDYRLKTEDSGAPTAEADNSLKPSPTRRGSPQTEDQKQQTLDSGLRTPDSLFPNSQLPTTSSQLTSDLRPLTTSPSSGLRSQVSSLSRSPGAGVLRIGKKADDTGAVFHGIMDEIRIYNRALSAEEIPRFNK